MSYTCLMRSCLIYMCVVDAFQLDTQPSPTSWTAAARFLRLPFLPPSLPLLISLLCFPHAITSLTSLPLQGNHRNLLAFGFLLTMESRKAESEMELPRPSSPCWKKRAPEAGLLADVKDHLEQFLNTSMDQHRICLKKTIRDIREYAKLKKQGKVWVLSSARAGPESDSAVKQSEIPPEGVQVAAS
ncbi:hypothetical protein B296_00008737 [Ensete ventricosum]|uniref:Uncharacterized protein n=1 Tax=Ensete ventricosum TaxID=4639 RepID=A0A426ZDP0_ENSVE|nr:hypothetical protein B296_00008737 [Ensete ventricosum]